MSVEREIPSSSTIYGFDSRIVRFGSIFLFVVGTFGNLVSFVIFSDVSLRRSSTFRYLALLSLMDLVVLYSGLLDLFLMVEYSGVISLRNINIVTCRLHTFVTYWSQHSSSWILCFISVDRAVATNFITFARKFCTPRSAELIVLSILIFIGLLNSHELIFLDLQETKTDEIHFNEKILPRNSSSTMIDFAPTKIGSTNQQIFDNKSILRQCQATENGQYGFFWDHVWEWIDVCLYAIIPFFVMSIGTFLIVYRVYYQQRRLFRSRRSNQNSSSGGGGGASKRAKSLFYLLFTLNLLYFILVSPVVLVTTIVFRDPTAELSYPKFKSIIYLMQYCNHSLNFIFYGITSPPYRRILFQWFDKVLTRCSICSRRKNRLASENNEKQRKTENVDLMARTS